jgi:hypothetical protein
VNQLVPAQAGAQLISLAVYIAIARWHVVPFLAKRGRADALIALLWVHVFRYVALQTLAAQREGFPISIEGATEIVVGDVFGAVVAMTAIMLLRRRIHAGVIVCWILVVETVSDTVLNIRGGIEEHLMGAATGVVWMILVFFVPAIVVSIGLLAWQLVARRGEALERTRELSPANARLKEQLQ